MSMDSIGRKMDAAWRQAISEGKKRAGKGLSSIGNKLTTHGRRGTVGQALSAAGLGGGAGYGIGRVGAHLMKKADTVLRSPSVVSKTMRSGAAIGVRKMGKRVGVMTAARVGAVGIGAATVGTAAVVGLGIGKAVNAVTRTKTQRKEIKVGEYLTKKGKKLSKG